MAFSTNRFEQLGFSDRLLLLGDKERDRIMNSWAGRFAEEIFPRIDENLFHSLYDDASGHMTRMNPVNVTVGALLLERLMDLTDEELVTSINCDVRYQVALHTTSDMTQPVSVRSLQRFRTKCKTAAASAADGNPLRTCLESFYGELDRYLQENFPGKGMDAGDLIDAVCRDGAREVFDPHVIADPAVFAIHRLPAHSDHVCYASEEEMQAAAAPGGTREATAFRCSLNGLWKFSYARNYDSTIRGFEKTSYDAHSWDEIRVPSHLQLEGWDKPAYVNVPYPWDGSEDLMPGEVPVRFNPVGSYVRYFRVPARMQGKPLFISFQGVESGFALWLNGAFVGYSEDSFTPSEFELTPFLREGENKLAVQVFKWTSGSWLEDQDMFRFSGIFRDVYLYTVPAVHLADLSVRALPDETGSSGKLILKTKLWFRPEGADKASKGTTRYRLVAAGGREAAAGSFANEKETELDVRISRPRLWSAEDPYLYDLYLVISSGTGEPLEYIHEKVGFRRFELRNGLMLLNGKRIVFRGVNRHEFTCDNGRAGMDEETVRQDLCLMKRLNINAVRTSHYPDIDALYRLCDELGLYLIAENNMETHGSWDVNSLPGGHPERIVPGDDRRWQPALLDRVDSCYERDKNHPSVLIWSAGNESYGGSVIYEMSRHFHQLDPDRLVHYEGIFHDRRFPATSDMESQMYPSPDAIRAFLAANRDKPFLCCEYSHSMGNSNGNLFEYTDLTDEEPRYQGGFLWDFVDQSLRERDRYGREYLAYGGDHRERPTDYQFSGDGIVAGDRTPYPKCQEIKFCYQSITAQVGADQVLIINRNLFVGTEQYDCVCTLAKNGRLLTTATLATSVPPLSRKAYPLPFALPSDPGEYVVTVSFCLRENQPWAQAGYELAFGQGVFCVQAEEQNRPRGGESFRIVRGTHEIGVHGEDYDVLLGNLNGGGLQSYRYGGKELLLAAPRLNFWRPLTDNDRGCHLGARCAIWRTASEYADILPPDLSTGTQMAEALRYPLVREEKGYVDVVYRYWLGADPGLTADVTYRVQTDGTVTFLLDYTPAVSGQTAGDGGTAGRPEDPENAGNRYAALLPPMPEFGMLLMLDADYDQVEYYGNGPEECYCDRERGAKLGIFRTDARTNMTPYLVPQECGNRTGVRWAKVTDRRGRGLLFTEGGSTRLGTAARVNHEEGGMNFSVLPYTPDEIESAAHAVELPPIHHTIVRVSLMQMGVGGDDSWGARTHPAFQLPNDRPLHFEFSMRGI